MQMESNALIFITSFLIGTLLFFLSSLRHHRGYPQNTPPTIPGALPLIGHLHFIIRHFGQPLHRTLSLLSSRYGPIIQLRFGSNRALLVSSPHAAKECLTTNDIIFANRPLSIFGKYFGFNYTTIAAASYGPELCNLKRIAITGLLSNARINSFSGLCADETHSLLRSLFSSFSTKDRAGRDEWCCLELRSIITKVILNSMMRMIYGRMEYDERFLMMITESTLLSEPSSLEDFFPLVRWIGFARREMRMMKIVKMIDDKLQNMVNEKRIAKGSCDDDEEVNKLIDVLLTLQVEDPQTYSDKIIKGMLWTMLAAGIETTSSTIEWALSLLLNDPKSLQRARDEIDSHVGHERLITHTDLPHLNFLQNIIKETLRLYPVAPLLIPHYSSMDCNLDGYNIAGHTTLLVNVYAIQRDPLLWNEPNSFKPERFDKEETSQSFQYIPFGSGRRRCPGEAMANRVIELTLGALIQCFEWKRVGKEMIDLGEGGGLTLPKLIPLVAKYKPHETMIHTLSQL